MTSTSSFCRARRWCSWARAAAARARLRPSFSACSSRARAASSATEWSKKPTTLTAWRQHVAWVPQRATLFTGTVADNIRLGDPDADDERVRAAAGLAGAAAVCRRPSGRLRDRGRRRRETPLRRRGPAHCAGPGLPARCAARHPRRAHGQPRCRERGGGYRCHEPPLGGKDAARDRTPAGARAARRSHRPARGRASRRRSRRRGA